MARVNSAVTHWMTDGQSPEAGWRKKAHRPEYLGRLLAVQTPTPIGGEGEQRPHWPTESSGEMGYCCVRGNDQVQLRDQRGGVGEILEVWSVIDGGQEVR